MPPAPSAQPAPFRPSVVTDFSPRAASSWRARALHVFSYVAAVGVVAAMMTEEFPVGASGRHALTGVQTAARGAYERVITGEWPAPPPPPPAAHR